MIVGILSDTHGDLSVKALKALAGVDHIVHAGDIGRHEILLELEKIAAVTAVRGNMDGGSWSASLPPAEILSLNGTTIYVLHNLDLLDLDPVAAGIDVVISGHTHRPAIKQQKTVLYLNPGSASYRRYGGPLSIARLEIKDDRLHPEIIVLEQ